MTTPAKPRIGNRRQRGLARNRVAKFRPDPARVHAGVAGRGVSPGRRRRARDRQLPERTARGSRRAGRHRARTLASRNRAAPVTDTTYMYPVAEARQDGQPRRLLHRSGMRCRCHRFGPRPEDREDEDQARHAQEGDARAGQARRRGPPTGALHGGSHSDPRGAAPRHSDHHQPQRQCREWGRQAQDADAAGQAQALIYGTAGMFITRAGTGTIRASEGRRGLGPSPASLPTDWEAACGIHRSRG